MEKTSSIRCEGIGIASLPQDIVINLLIRLPVKSLLRFKSVSKSWYSFINSQYFIKTHLQYSNKNTSFSSYRICAPYDGYLASLPVASLLNDNSDDDYPLDIIPPPPTYDHWYRCNVSLIPTLVVGCLNGIFCFRSMSESFVLCNPSTRVSKILPHHDVTADYYVIACGFGWEEVCDEYKLVVIFAGKEDDGVANRTLVYNSKQNLYKTLDYDSHLNDPHWDFLSDTEINVGQFVSGKLYWLNWSFKREEHCHEEIVRWELESEMFGVIKTPSSAIEYQYYDYKSRLGMFRECLSYLLHDWKDEIMVVWVMKEYGVMQSWEKHMKITFSHVRRRLLEPPFCIKFFKSENGEILRSFGGHVYVESLVMLI